MNKHELKLSSNSIESAGLPTKWKDAIAEYIWNGFDAQADTINIEFEASPIGMINTFSISDNGDGIEYESLKNTFGFFLDSQKKNSFSDSAFIKGKNGKGRFSFKLFANNASWFTTYIKNKEFYSYNISIDKDSTNIYSDKPPEKSSKDRKGTRVQFYGLTKNINGNLLNSFDFVDYLKSQFGWFLLLNKQRNYSIRINGEIIDYSSIIADHENISLEIDEHKFDVTYVCWRQKIGEKYFFYYLDSEMKDKGRKHTGLNQNAIDFHHSVYVNSNFFNDFNFQENDNQTELPGFGRNILDKTYRELHKKLRIYISQKEKEFIRNSGAVALIGKYEHDKVFPKFTENKWDQQRKAELVEVVKEIYCIQPKIFKTLNHEQSKTIVGFLNLLLDSNERDNVLTILSDIVSISSEEREQLASLLAKTGLSKITKTINLIENRYMIVEGLKKLVFELEEFTTERDHIQKIVEENYWLFGEQYHLTSADKSFQTLLLNYLIFLETGDKSKVNKTELMKIKNEQHLKRPDIFLCRKHTVSNSLSSDLINENIMVELKRPSIVIGKEQYDQIENYMNIIIEDPRFNSKLQEWKFILIGKDVDDYIKRKYKSQEIKNKRFLVEKVENYEIYAMRWDDLFTMFEIKHRYLFDKLDYDKELLENELTTRGITLSRDLSDSLTDKILTI